MQIKCNQEGKSGRPAGAGLAVEAEDERQLCVVAFRRGSVDDEASIDGDVVADEQRHVACRVGGRVHPVTRPQSASDCPGRGPCNHTIARVDSKQQRVQRFEPAHYLCEYTSNGQLSTNHRQVQPRLLAAPARAMDARSP